MEKKFSRKWISSKQPRKQRKYRYNAPLHIKQKFMSSTLSKELRKKYGKRSIGLKKGDKVRVLRGQFRKHEGKIEKVDLNKTKVVISGVEIVKKDGTKGTYPINPSNIMIIELNLDDKMRRKSLERGNKNEPPKKA